MSSDSREARLFRQSRASGAANNVAHQEVRLCGKPDFVETREVRLFRQSRTSEL